jgi:hypothetical protein
LLVHAKTFTDDNYVCQELVQHHCYVAHDYDAELGRWQREEFTREHQHVFQLPFDLPVWRNRLGVKLICHRVSFCVQVALTAEELQARHERKMMNIRRLQEMHRKKENAKVWGVFPSFFGCAH